MPVASEFDEAYDDTWRYERFITTIQQKAGIAWDKAEQAARATLETLAERISGGAARDIAADLPQGLRDPLLGGGPDAEPFDAVEFVRRVADREGVDTETAERHVRAVFTALARLVRQDEVAGVAAELPQDYQPLFGDALQLTRDPTPPEVAPYDEFLDRVAGRAGLDRAAAERAVQAVLTTLAARISGGRVDDLIAVLPAELRPPLQRGRNLSGGRAHGLSLDEFVARIAEREDVNWEDALDHARAVFQSLREILPDKERSGLLAELPRGYQEALF